MELRELKDARATKGSPARKFCHQVIDPLPESWTQIRKDQRPRPNDLRGVSRRWIGSRKQFSQ